MDELNNLKDIVHNSKELKDKIANDLMTLEILELEYDEKVKKELESNLEELQKTIHDLELFTLLNSK